MRSEDIGRQRFPGIQPRLANVRGAGAVIDRAGSQRRQRLCDRFTIEQIDVLPAPACDRDAGFRKELDEMAAGKPAGTRHENGAQDWATAVITNGGHRLSRSESVGAEVGQSMASRGSFHMMPDSWAGAYSLAVM